MNCRCQLTCDEWGNPKHKAEVLPLYIRCTTLQLHYIYVIMSATASQITSLTIVYSTVHSDADERKLQSSASLAFGTGDRWLPAQRASNAENVSTWWRHHDYDSFSQWGPQQMRFDVWDLIVLVLCKLVRTQYHQLGLSHTNFRLADEFVAIVAAVFWRQWYTLEVCLLAWCAIFNKVL